MKVTRIVPALLLVASLMVVVLSAQFVHSNPVSAQTSTGTTTAVVTSPTGTTTAVVSPSPSPTTPPVLAATVFGRGSGGSYGNHFVRHN